MLITNVIDVLCEYGFFFNDTATTEIYTLSLHDALPIFETLSGDAVDPRSAMLFSDKQYREREAWLAQGSRFQIVPMRSEEHTSELQSRQYIVCRLLLEKKKTTC